MTPNEVIQHFGNSTKAAYHLGKTVRCIDKWIAAGHIPYWSQLAIQTVTKNKLRARKDEGGKS